MFHIGCIAGTRPEVIKMAPVIQALKKNPAFKVSFIFTGQHQELALDVMKIFDLVPDFTLNCMKPNQSLAELCNHLTPALNQLYQENLFHVILVQGDTTSALLGGLLASYHKIPVGHVEAGLRSFDLDNPFPEEINRALLSRLARWHFVPTELAKLHLIQENIENQKIYLTGNTVVDAIYSILATHPKLDLLLDPTKKTILVTSHRRESFGKPLENICLALKQITMLHQDIQIVFPVHPNPQVKQTVKASLKDLANIHLIDALPYPDFIALMNHASLILTDSGGIQEEASVLKKPLLILRDVTERSEIVNNGFAKLVGTSVEKIVMETDHLLELIKSQNTDFLNQISPYGNGDASEKIANILLQSLSPAVKKETPKAALELT